MFQRRCGKNCRRDCIGMLGPRCFCSCYPAIIRHVFAVCGALSAIPHGTRGSPITLHSCLILKIGWRSSEKTGISFDVRPCDGVW